MLVATPKRLYTSQFAESTLLDRHPFKFWALAFGRVVSTTLSKRRCRLAEKAKNLPISPKYDSTFLNALIFKPTLQQDSVDVQRSESILPLETVVVLLCYNLT